MITLVKAHMWYQNMAISNEKLYNAQLVSELHAINVYVDEVWSTYHSIKVAANL